MSKYIVCHGVISPAGVGREREKGERFFFKSLSFHKREPSEREICDENIYQLVKHMRYFNYFSYFVVSLIL